MSLGSHEAWPRNVQCQMTRHSPVLPQGLTSPVVFERRCRAQKDEPMAFGGTKQAGLTDRLDGWMRVSTPRTKRKTKRGLSLPATPRHP